MVQTLGKSNKCFHWFYLKWLGLHSFVRWPRKARCGRGQPKSSVPSICFSWMFTWKLQGAYQTSSFSLSSEIFSNGSPRLSSSWPFESAWTVTSWLNKPLISPRFQRGNRKKAEKEKVTVIFEEKPRDHESEPGSESDSDGGLGAEDTLFEVGADSIEQDEELKLHCMGCNSYFTAVIETNFGNVTKNLPTRWLPPGTIRMLYMKMQMENQDHGSFKISYSHFWRVFRKRWHNVIRFLPESTHGACDDCASLKQQFARSQDPQSKFNAAKAYQSHLDLVYKDRDLEAFLQSANPLTRSQQPLCLHWHSFRFQSP